MKRVLFLMLSIGLTYGAFGQYQDGRQGDPEKTGERITWSGSISVGDDATVDKGDTLWINPGTTVTFIGNYRLVVHGTVIARGTSGTGRITFTANDEWQGIRLQSNERDSAIFEYCTFEKGYALRGNVDTARVTRDFNLADDQQGGAIFAKDRKKGLLIDNCVFDGNKAYNAGGAVASSRTNMLITRSIFKNNKSGGGGGAIAMGGEANDIGNSLRSPLDITIECNIVACQFYDNEATINYKSRSLFLDDDVNGFSAAGGAAVFSLVKGGIYNSLFYGNKAARGGAYSIVFSSIISQNTIVWNNKPDSYQVRSWGGLHVFHSITGGIEKTIANLVNIGIFKYENSFAVDPQFVDAGSKNFRVGDRSPAINSGADVPSKYEKYLPEKIQGVRDIGPYETEARGYVVKGKVVTLNGTAVSGVTITVNGDNVPLQKDTFETEVDLNGRSSIESTVKATISDQNFKIYPSEIKVKGYKDIRFTVMGACDLAGDIEEKNKKITKSQCPVVNVVATVPIKDTLTVEGGVEFRFHGDVGMRVLDSGVIMAKGTSSDTILFTLPDSSNVVSSTELSAGWSGIRFEGGANAHQQARTSVFEYVKFEKATAKGLPLAEGDKRISAFGGAVYAKDYDRIRFLNSEFYGNVASRGGGGIYAENTTIELENTLFHGNRAGYVGAGLGYKGGSIKTYNVAFIDNIAGREGGGAYIDLTGGNAVVMNTLFTANQLIYPSLGNKGAGLARIGYNGKFTISNSILWGNISYAPEYAELYSGGGNTEMKFSVIRKSVPDGVNYKDRWNLINVAPDWDENYKLKATSRLINWGDAGNPTTKDLAGEDRVKELIDVGPYEFQGNSQDAVTIEVKDVNDYKLGSGDYSVINKSRGGADLGTVTNEAYEGDGTINGWGWGDTVVIRLKNPKYLSVLPDSNFRIVRGGTADFFLALTKCDKWGELKGKNTFETGDCEQYNLVGDLILEDAEDTLEIRSGVTVNSVGKYAIKVENGYIKAEGTKASPVKFTAKDVWRGVRFDRIHIKPSNSSFDYCEFEKGYAEGYIGPTHYSDEAAGGALFVRNDSITVTHSLFSGNIAKAAGGAIGLTHSSVVVKNSRFINNVALQSGGGAIEVNNSSYSTTRQRQAYITGSVFYKDSAGYYGGAISSRNVELYVGNCDFVDNATRGATLGNAIYYVGRQSAGYVNINDTSIVENSIFYRNGGTSVSSIADATVGTSSPLNVKYNILQPKDTRYDRKDGNIIADPKFAAENAFETLDGWKLSQESPAIDGGLKYAPRAKWVDSRDLWGKNRGEVGWDIGVQEYGTIPPNVWVRVVSANGITPVNGVAVAPFTGKTTDAKGELKATTGIVIGQGAKITPERPAKSEDVNLRYSPTTAIAKNNHWHVFSQLGSCDIDTFKKLNVISENTSWDKCSEYHIFSDVEVEEGKLTIAPGTKVVFHGYYAIRVKRKGTIHAVGTESKKITFTTANGISNWGGIRIEGANKGTALITATSAHEEAPWFSHCHFEKSSRSLFSEGGALYLEGRNGLKVENSSFYNNAAGYGGGLAIHSSDSVDANSNVFYKNRGGIGAGAVEWVNSNGKFYNSLFLKNTGVIAGAVTISGTDQSAAPDTLWFVNNTLAGNGGDYTALYIPKQTDNPSAVTLTVSKAALEMRNTVVSGNSSIVNFHVSDEDKEKTYISAHYSVLDNIKDTASFKNYGNLIILPEALDYNDSIFLPVNGAGGFDSLVNRGAPNSIMWFDEDHRRDVVGNPRAFGGIDIGAHEKLLIDRAIGDDSPVMFTPNGDGINDWLLIPSLKSETAQVVILSRDGVPVYENLEFSNGSVAWDGKANIGPWKESKVPSGAYVVKITPAGGGSVYAKMLMILY